jgi:hypothetical protein
VRKFLEVCEFLAAREFLEIQQLSRTGNEEISEKAPLKEEIPLAARV